MRSLAIDSRESWRVYLGAADGHVFRSEDGGEHWTLRGRIGQRHDGVVQRIVVDRSVPERLLAAVWHQDPSAGGGVFLSEDGGASWTLAGLAGEAVRALEQAPSDPRAWTAGTRTGVFRSLDGGATWERISPAGHAELRNLDSLAIDPRDPSVIYAGTYHLPWKTTDGGETWVPVRAGMIDDSDVMSIVVDPSAPDRVFAGACSGIYRSENAAKQWAKIQGLPYSARRTHAIRIDPKSSAVLYAATTRGFWKTADGGATWRRMTPREWVVNDAQILPNGRLLLATESRGVLRSDNAGESFLASNLGFLHAGIFDFAVDPLRPERILARLGTSPEALALSTDGGRSWQSLRGTGKPAEIRRLYGTPWGWWAALAQGGIVRWDERRKAWLPFGWIIRSAGAGRGASTNSKRQIVRKRFSAVVEDVAFSGERVFLATHRGLFVGDHRGRFSHLPAAKDGVRLLSVRAGEARSELWVAAHDAILRSADGGRTWIRLEMPRIGEELSWIEVIDHESEDLILAGTSRGVYVSRDGGRLWSQVGAGLPATRAQAVALDQGRVLAAMSTGGLFLSEDAGRSWEDVAANACVGSLTRIAFVGRGHLIAASSTEGLYRVELLSASAEPPTRTPGESKR